MLVAVALFVAAGCGGGGTLGPKSLAKQAEAVQSLAAEGALLAGDSADGPIDSRLPRGALVRAGEGGRHRRGGARGRAKAEPPLEPKLRRLAGIAARVHADLDRLGGASTDEQREIERRLEAAAKQSEQLGEELG